jgi:hypothetical protein
MKTILFCGIAFTIAGCAGPETRTDTRPWTEPEYTTGSNIPRRNRQSSSDPVQVIDKETLQRQAPFPTPVLQGGGRAP